MRKRLLLLITAFSAMGSIGYSQCVPDVSITTPGIYPDTVTNLPDGTAGVFYSTDIQVRVLTDTVVSGFAVDVIDIVIDSVVGMPAGFAYSCTPSNCTFPSASNGCIRLFGTENTPGTYGFDVHVTLNGLLFGFPVSQAAVISGYSVTLNTPPPAPVAAFSASTTTPCEGDDVTFTDNSTNSPDTWSWSFQGGTPSSSTDQNPVVTYLNPGTYDVTLTSSNGGGSDDETIVGYIVVAEKPLAKITPTNDVSFCFGESDVLTANAGTGFTYEWYKYGNVLIGETAQTLTVSTAGSYKVKVTDPATGCTKRSGLREVIVNTAPEVTITAQSATTFCKDGNVTIFANTTATNLQWTKGGIDIPGATINPAVATNSGFYKVRITSDEGCTRTSSGITVTVLPAPNAGVTANGPLAFCQGDDVELSALSAPGNAYQWELNLQPINGATTNTYVANAAGKYTVFVEAANGCFRRSGVKKVEIVCRESFSSPVANNSVSITPNPNSGESLLELSIAEKGKVSIDIFDITGKHQLQVSNATMDAGLYTLNLDMLTYPKGIYLVRVVNGNKIVTTKMVIQ